MEIPSSDIFEFIEMSDCDGDGSLSFAEFARSLTPLMSVKYNLS